MEYVRNKPKLVFFLYRYDAGLPEYLLMHKREHVKCLAEFFDVTTIDHDCDYQQVCDQYQPDITLFESAFNIPFSYCKRPRIMNIGACQKVPRLGFLHADSFSQGRAGFLSDMDHWGIETFFAIAITAADHLPEVSNNLFIWPNFIDAEIYHDYGEPKHIPVLFTGLRSSVYPWRQKITQLVSKRYPSLFCPHPGNYPKTLMQVMFGEPYARMLNASWFVPSCGTVAKEVVRKHFEIPACKACLITERSPALEAAGFLDMTNCVFADESNVLDKLDYLSRNPDRLRGIIDAGYELIHTRHTLKQRNQIFQWFNLNKNLKPNERIVQTGPFGPLRIVDKTLGPANSHIISDGLHLELLNQGDEKLWQGNYVEAESLYLKCLNYIFWMPEPQFRMTLLNLYKGNPRRALACIMPLIQFTFREYRAIDPDPVEWAYFIITFLCLGKLKTAVRCAWQFSWLRHPELDRICWVTTVLNKRENAVALRAEYRPKYRVSIHRLPNRDLEQWIEHLCVMLKACGQGELAERVRAIVAAEGTGAFEAVQQGNRFSTMTENEGSAKRWLRTRGLTFLPKGAAGHFRFRSLYLRVPPTMRRSIKNVLHGLEAKCGSFLPYHLSRNKNDVFFRAIQDLSEREDIKAVLVVGANLRQGSTVALLAGVQKNNSKPSVNCLGISRRGLLHKRFAKENLVKWYSFSSPSSEHVSENIEKTVRKIKEENQTSFFDILLIDGSEFKDHVAIAAALEKELYTAKFVILDDINRPYNHKSYNDLLRNPEYMMVDCNPDLRDGYAIFEKQDCSNVGNVGALCSTFTLAE